MIMRCTNPRTHSLTHSRAISRYFDTAIPRARHSSSINSSMPAAGLVNGKFCVSRHDRSAAVVVARGGGGGCTFPSHTPSGPDSAFLPVECRILAPL